MNTEEVAKTLWKIERGVFISVDFDAGEMVDLIEDRRWDPATVKENRPD